MEVVVNNLTFSYHKNKILDDISFELKPNKFTMLLGANGSGKSTLFKIMLGFYNNYKGEILFDNTNIKDMSIRKRSDIISYIPQANHNIYNYPVIEMVSMGFANRIGITSNPKHEDYIKAEKSLNEVGISHLKDRGFKKLSGGEQQLVLIARALAQNADVILMDEPISSLDYGNQIMILNKVKGLIDKGFTVFMSNHNPTQSLMYSDRIIALNNNKIIADGDTVDVLNPKLIKDLYNIDTEFADTPFGKTIMEIKK